MEGSYIAEKIFENINYTETPLTKGEYERCSFVRCDFSNADLSDIKFCECTFTGCNLSLSNVSGTAFVDVKFGDCKMLGLHFEKCHAFGLSLSFDRCILDHSSFYQTKMRKTPLINTQLREVDFTECDLTGTVFEHCDLAGATFENTVIEKADLRTSFGYSIDGEINRIKKARFSFPGVAGLLDKYDIQIDS